MIDFSEWNPACIWFGFLSKEAFTSHSLDEGISINLLMELSLQGTFYKALSRSYNCIDWLLKIELGYDLKSYAGWPEDIFSHVHVGFA